MIRIVSDLKEVVSLAATAMKAHCVIYGAMAPSSSLHVFFLGKLRIMQEHISSLGDAQSRKSILDHLLFCPAKGRLMIG